MMRMWRWICLAIATTLLACVFGALAEPEDTLYLPADLKVIDEQAFMDAESLGKVVIPEGVTEIGSKAFANSGTREVVFPASPEPTTSTEPTASTEPSASPEPTTSTEPTVSTEPSVSPEPTMPTLTNPEAEALATALGMTGDELAAATGYSIEQLNAMSAEEIGALTLTTNNIVWQINEARDGVVIRGCVESARQLTVEATYGSLPVVEIGDEAFKEDAVLEEIIVPSTVTRIGKRAFRGCVKLKSMR